jgi:hypothetical protein
MSTSRDVPNPLRPYYRPPSFGIPQDAPGTTSSGTHGLGPKNGSAAAYASSAARDMFDYSDYLADSSPSSVEAARKVLDDWMYKYFSILLSQPFDVAKTILQVRSQGSIESGVPTVTGHHTRSDRSGFGGSLYDDVCLINHIATITNSIRSTLRTTLTKMSLHISRLLHLRQHHTLLRVSDGDGLVPEKIRSLAQNLPHPLAINLS